MKRIKWTEEKIHKLAKKCKSRSEFSKKYKNACEAARSFKILDKVCSHMTRPVRSGKNNSNFKWTLEKLKIEALKYTTKGSFDKGNPSAYRTALHRDDFEEICFHMPKHVDQSGENHHSFKWTFELLQEEALKYSTRGDFQKGSNVAHQTALHRDILDEICSHMIPLFHFWADEELYLEAFKYKTRSDFVSGNASAYYTATSRGILDKVCSHMKRSAGTSKPEIELLNILKESFPDLIRKTFSVSVPDKPYIHRFQVDILDFRNKLGIEFDGKYHHSYKFMRNDPKKYKWSDDDIRNYHEIKDSSILSCHGITILHIKEEDWNNNKQVCIDKCVAFLGTEKKKVA